MGETSGSDAELARRVLGGTDPDAEAELCTRFAPRIRLYGLKHLRDEERARDLVQSVLVVVIEALRAGRVEDIDHIERFVLGASRNLALRAKEVERRAEPTDHETLAKHAANEPEPSLGSLDANALLRCLATLDVRAQAILHLSFYRDKSANEIASVLETTAGNVRVVRHRAMGQLRHCLEAPRASLQ